MGEYGGTHRPGDELCSQTMTQSGTPRLYGVSDEALFVVHAHGTAHGHETCVVIKGFRQRSTKIQPTGGKHMPAFSQALCQESPPFSRIVLE